MKREIVFLAFLFIVFGRVTIAQNQTYMQTYQNPVIAGDVPDPTIIRVNQTYYAAGTSSDFVPCYPLYQSSDLINWRRIGFCFNEAPKWAVGSFWAPELFYNNGVYYLYYTAKRKTDNVSCIGVTTTTDINLGFKDHGVIVEWGREAIDPFVFKDTDGKLYISWKAYGLNNDRPIEILASELSVDGLSLAGKQFSLTRYDEGWVGAGDEGQCLVKKDGYYYLFYAVGGCCDSRCSYRVMVARSKNLKTGWKQYTGNPILEDGTDWKCPGHGTLVETTDHRYFYLYHAYHAKDFEFIGRQGMLDEVIWDKATGWPHFKSGKTPSATAEIPVKNTVQLRDSVYQDDFATDANLKLWQWDVKGTKPEMKLENGRLILSSTQKGIAFSGLSPQTGDYTFETTLAELTTAFSGISIYGNQSNLLAFVANQSSILLFQIKAGERKELFELSYTGNNFLSLKLEAKQGRYFKFFWSLNQRDWNPLKMQNEYVDGAFLPQWGVAMRTGILLDNRQDDRAEYSFVRLVNRFK